MNIKTLVHIHEMLKEEKFQAELHLSKLRKEIEVAVDAYGPDSYEAKEAEEYKKNYFQKYLRISDFLQDFEDTNWRA